MRRWPDLISLLQGRAAETSGAEHLEVMLEIAEIYLQRMRNQAEALTAYQRVLALDPDNRTALSALDQMYEKRREWERLIDIRTRLAELEDGPDAVLTAYKALAEYASKRIRRPDPVSYTHLTLPTKCSV